MPYTKPMVQTERTGLAGTPLGNTNFYIPVVIAKTRGKTTQISRTASVSGDTENIYVNGAMVSQGDTVTYDRVTYSSTSKETTALPHLPVVEVLSVSTDHNNPYKREFVEGTDFTISKTSGTLNFTNAPAILAPEIDSLTESTGGSISANTYDIAIVSRDANSNTTTADTSQIVVSSGSASIIIKWGKIANSNGYLIYGKPSTGGSSEWSLITTVTTATTTSYTATSSISTGAVTLPVTNTTKHTPSDSDYVYVNYTYSQYTYNSPKRYYTIETVQQDHGVGSELSNAARLILGPLGQGQAAGSMYAVAPQISTGEVLGYQDAIEACESIQELALISTSSTSDTVNETLKAHCEDMSEVENGKERFCFVSTTSTIMADTDVSVLTAKMSALNESSRCVFVVTDGGHPHVDSWENTLDKLNVIDNSTKSNAYTENLTVDGQWHAIATMGMVANLSDPAVPSTNKQVYGISSGTEGSVNLWTETRKDTIATAGGLILEDRFNNLFVRHGLTLSQASVEDSELSIVMAESYMARTLRDNHEQYIGKKLTSTLLAAITKKTNDVLNGMVRDQIIASFSTPNVYQDSTKPTWVYVTFTYKPVYPTNVIKFEWGFDISG